MTSAHQVVGSNIEEIDDDVSAGILCSEGIKRDGDDWVIDGIDCAPFMDNPFVDVEHTSPPVAVVEGIRGVVINSVKALAIAFRWGPSEIPLIAETRARVAAGLYSMLSAALDPLEVEPLDPRNPRGGLRVTRSTLLGASIVKLPADPLARITMRSFTGGSAALYRALRPIGAGAIERARRDMVKSHVPAVPIMLMDPGTRTRLYTQELVSRSNAAWAGTEGMRRLREREFSYEQRQADLRELADAGEGELARRRGACSDGRLR